MKTHLLSSKSSSLKSYPDWIPPMLVAEIRSDSQWYFPWVLGAFSVLLQLYFTFSRPYHDAVWAYPAIVLFLLIDGWGYPSGKWNQENMDLLQMAGISPPKIILARWIHLMTKCTLMLGAYGLVVKLGAPELDKSINWGRLVGFQCVAIGMAMPLCFFKGAGKALVIFIGLILVWFMDAYHVKGANPFGVWGLDMALSVGFGYLFSHAKVYSMYGVSID